jgi:hypothetical protein
VIAETTEVVTTNATLHSKSEKLSEKVGG